MGFGRPLPPPSIQQRGLLLAIDGLDGPEPADVPRERDALVRLQPADEVPPDTGREQLGFLEEFLDVVFAEVEVVCGGVVEGEDVGCGLEF